MSPIVIRSLRRPEPSDPEIRETGGDERWLPVVGFENHYSVSDKGRVWSDQSSCFMSPRLKQGYPTINLCKRGMKKSAMVHRLVALAFIPNPKGLPTVNHRDLNKENNNVNNLEWCSQHQNIWHYEMTRTNRSWVGRKDGLTAREADTIEALHRTGLIGIRRLSKAFGVSQTTIWRIVNGESHATVD